jgi:hypothetical protein
MLRSNIACLEIDLDPTSMFTHTVTRRLPCTEFAFVLTTGEFTFGLQTAPREPTVLKVSAYSTKLKLTNTSPFTCELTIALDAPRTPFVLDTNSLSLEPCEEHQVTVGFKTITAS